MNLRTVDGVEASLVSHRFDRLLANLLIGFLYWIIYIGLSFGLLLQKVSNFLDHKEVLVEFNIDSWQFATLFRYHDLLYLVVTSYLVMDPSHSGWIGP